MSQLGLTNMSKRFSLTLEDDGTIKVKPVPPSPPPPNKQPPPGQDFVISLSIIILGIIFIVNFLISSSVENTSEQSPEPLPTNSPNNSTAKSSNNYEPVKMYFEEY